MSANGSPFRKQWARSGDLWSGGQSERLAAAVLHALVAACGPVREEYHGPFTIEESASEEGQDPTAPRCYTLAEIGAELGLSRERVRQVESLALRNFARGLYRENPALFGFKPPNLNAIRGWDQLSRVKARAARYARRRDAMAGAAATTASTVEAA